MALPMKGTLTALVFIKRADRCRIDILSEGMHRSSWLN